MADDWYALQIRPRWESLVAAHLRYRGYEPFLPTYQAKRRWADRIKILDSPLFPGYLFCQFNLNTRMPILTTPGVSGIVDRKSTRLNSSHRTISYAVFCLKKNT